MIRQAKPFLLEYPTLLWCYIYATLCVPPSFYLVHVTIRNLPEPTIYVAEGSLEEAGSLVVA